MGDVYCTPYFLIGHGHVESRFSSKSRVLNSSSVQTGVMSAESTSRCMPKNWGLRKTEEKRVSMQKKNSTAGLNGLTNKGVPFH